LPVLEAEADAEGRRLISLDRATVNRLEALRDPREVIVWLAAAEARR
jgi:hypothetical protein